ncbi:hypothetical protein AHAS_Ahas19G0097200 [Arachis hypogaea]
MLVQELSAPKSTNSKPNSRTNGSLPTNRFAETKNLDFSVWISENLYKIVDVVALTPIIAALFFFRNVDNTAAHLCFEKQAHDLEKIAFPCVDWNNIAPLRDMASKFANFWMERWIVVSVSGYPSDLLRGLARIKGWQVLAIGNSITSSDWSLKGAIYL